MVRIEVFGVFVTQFFDKVYGCVVYFYVGVGRDCLDGVLVGCVALYIEEFVKWVYTVFVSAFLPGKAQDGAVAFVEICADQFAATTRAVDFGF